VRTTCMRALLCAKTCSCVSKRLSAWPQVIVARMLSPVAAVAAFTPA